ncbi:MAG: 1,4-dihydroxy-2-naphthoyl-CoA hydrolase [Solirubrobacteraceae bacterium]|nr:1,4-dihydroxy-2-naphthoyl-CoA hydrolase [Solirubrobacteraceae bacterium]
MNDHVPAQHGLNALIGLELDARSADEVRAHVDIDERHLQPAGLVHGGVYAAIAEAVASIGTFIGTGEQKMVAGLSNFTSFLRPVFTGDTLSAVGVPRHRGRTTWVWEVDLTDSQDRLCATTRVTIAVRDVVA